MSEAGLGLGNFIHHGRAGGGGRFLPYGDKSWRNTRRWIEVLLHLKAAIAYPFWHHSWPLPDSKEEEKNGERVITRFLRFPKYAGLEPELFYKKQYFFADKKLKDRRELPATVDPTDLLYEWMRWSPEATRIPLNRVMFSWENPSPNARERVVEWRRGKIARLVKGGANDWGHRVDGQLDYSFVVVQYDSPGSGPLIAQEKGAVGRAMQELLTKRLEALGDQAGNPHVKPVVFKWSYHPDNDPSDQYQANAIDKHPISDEHLRAISSDDWPDPTPYITPQSTDLDRIYASMEMGAKSAGTFDEIPFDRLFAKARAQTPRVQVPANAPVGRTESQPSGNGTSAPASGVATSAPSSTTTTGGVTRSRRPKAPPIVPTIPCDACGKPMPETAAKCESCGEEYDVTVTPDPVSGTSAPASTTSQPAPTTAPTPSAEAPTSVVQGESIECFNCKTVNPPRTAECTQCGASLGEDDDIPFDHAPTAMAEAVGAHPTVLRFWARVVKTDRCWEWTGPTYQVSGYGQTTGQIFGKQSMTAHRFAWLVTRGPVPDGLFVLHDCDNRRCVRPSRGHLKLGTHGDNMQDMVARGRSFYARARGLPRRRLTDEQRAYVLTSRESALALARRLGCDEKTIRSLRNRDRAGLPLSIH